MELDEETINASWSKDNNGNPEFFIINEAIISKLCTLGEDNEPCFEGASIGAPIIQFAFADGFKEQVFSMMNELKELLNKGGDKVFTKYSVEIGDSLWTALYNHTKDLYSIEGVYEDGEQKFAVLKSDEKYYRLDFSISEDDSVEFATEFALLEDYTPEEEPQFDAAAVAEYVKSIEEEKCPECGKPVSQCDCSSEDVCEKCGKPVSECECAKEEDKKEKYNLEEIQEYVELNAKYSNLEKEYNLAQERIASLESQNSELVIFKKGIEKAEKEKMIASFYMLSDADKADVIQNIDTYSVDEIEAKLSIICVRNKVSFSSLEGKKEEESSITFNLNNGASDDTPAWIKALRSVANNM